MKSLTPTTTFVCDTLLTLAVSRRRRNRSTSLAHGLALFLAALLLLFLGTSPARGQATLATIITPANGATNVDPGTAFTWNQVSDAQAYFIWIGSQKEQKDVWSSNSMSASLNTITPPAGTLATNTTYYLRMWTEINGLYTGNFVDTTFTTGLGTAHLSAPTNGATNVDPFVPFTWTAVSSAQSYTLDVGSTPGGSNVYTGAPTTATNVTVPGLQPNTTYYTTLFTQFSSGTESAATTFTTGTGLAHLITPANGATNVDPGAQMTWNAVSNAQAYYLYIGTSVGAKDVWGSNSTTATSVTPQNLAANTLYYARMWTEKTSIWYHVDTTFTTGNGTSHLTYPANGATNIDPWQPFAWTTVANATSYALNIGSSPGGSDIYSSPALTVTSLTVPGIKQNTTYYAQLSTTSSLGTTSVNTSFTTGLGMAHLIAPANGATNVDPYQPFTWNNVPGATYYYIYVGDTPGVTDVYNSGTFAPTITSRIVSGLLGGETYYVKIWTYINSTWYSNSISFSTATQPLPSSASAFRSAVQQETGAVRLMTQGLTNVPIAGTPLATVVAQDNRTTAFCTEYARTLAEQLIGQRISIRVRSMTFDGTSFESHVTTEYWDPFLSQWITADPTFGIVYWDASTTAGLSVAAIEADVVADNWSAIQPYILYATSNGEAYAHNYYMDPILLYLNPLSPGVTVAPATLPNSPTPYITVHSTSSVGTAGNWLFSFVNQTDTVTISDPIKGVMTFSPLGLTLYSQAVNLNTGWSITSSPSGLQILSMNRYLYF